MNLHTGWRWKEGTLEENGHETNLVLVYSRATGQSSDLYHNQEEANAPPPLSNWFMNAMLYESLALSQIIPRVTKGIFQMGRLDYPCGWQGIDRTGHDDHCCWQCNVSDTTRCSTSWNKSYPPPFGRTNEKCLQDGEEA